MAFALTDDERRDLAMPGGPVSFVERTVAPPSADVADIASASRFITQHIIRHEGDLPRRLTVIGGVVEEIVFIGGVAGGMLHALVTLAIELSQGRLGLEDPRTPALMAKLRTSRFVSVIAAPDCEDSVTLTRSAQRLLQLSGYMKLAIVAPEMSRRFGQGRTPALLIEGELAAVGPMDEHALAQLIVRPR